MNDPGTGSDPLGESDEMADALADEGARSISIGPGTIDPHEHRPGPFARGEPEHYVAVLLVESSSDASGYEPFYEESFVLLTAESADEAQEKAREYGKQHETSYEDEHDRLVTWKLKHVLEVKPVEDATFDDGAELYSRFFRNYSGYRSFEPRLDGEEP